MLRYIRFRTRLRAFADDIASKQEQAQLNAIRADIESEEAKRKLESEMNRDFEGGHGGQEDLEDRYATTSGEH